MTQMNMSSGDPETRSPASALRVMALNRGSSSLKLAVYGFADDTSPGLLLTAKVDRIGQPQAALAVDHAATGRKEEMPVEAGGHGAEAGQLLDWLQQRLGLAPVAAVGHRIVHGGPRYAAPEMVTPEMLDELRRISPFDPEHLPAEIDTIDAVSRWAPGVPQVACFDTAFHRHMPRVARLLPIPRKYDRQGIERYGFHGLSYEYLTKELALLAGPAAAQGRVVMAHLGNGASMAAVREGKSIDTTMGFTPTAGLPMSTRTGDLDPGLVAYFARTEGMTAEQFHKMVNSGSGLAGVSEISGDVRDLLAREASDERAAEALALFCYEIKKRIGAYAAALGGIDTLVFAGGIGENAAEIRAPACEGLDFLGIRVDPQKNAQHAAVISAADGRVAVRVIRTNEELMVAQATYRVTRGG
jgi:acetate kinase